ncbi:DUF922 domain-containing Zn-dependent protease [bacterium]|nr:DUF922 domain-containing Zn-dependent protease [bacterium]
MGAWIALSLLLGLSLEMHAQYRPWSSSNSLAWSDFQGTAPPLSTDGSENHDAFVHTEILWDLNWDPGSRTLDIQAQATFVHPVSWYRSAIASAALLTHEIGHFDYAEIHARQLKQRMSESQELAALLKRCDVQEAEIATLLTRYHSEELEELQFDHDFYDSETDHGQNLTMQRTFTNITIPDLLNDLSAYTSPTISITADNEGAPPIPDDYQGTLKYTIQLGLDPAVAGGWSWNLEGQWSISISANEDGGVSNWEHHYIDNQVEGLLLEATSPSVPSIRNVPIIIQNEASGSHYWVDASDVVVATMPDHELTFAPIAPQLIASPAFAENTTAPFGNIAALALGTWMKEQGTPELKMRAPITCPTQSIQYRIDLGLGQFFEIEWRLTRIAPPPSASTANGAGGSGVAEANPIITHIDSDLDAGTLVVSWDATSGGLEYSIEASSDLITWAEIGNVTASSAATISFIDTDSHSVETVRFYRVLLIHP